MGRKKSLKLRKFFFSTPYFPITLEPLQIVTSNYLRKMSIPRKFVNIKSAKKYGKKISFFYAVKIAKKK